MGLWVLCKLNLILEIVFELAITLENLTGCHTIKITWHFKQSECFFFIMVYFFFFYCIHFLLIDLGFLTFKISSVLTFLFLCHATFQFSVSFHHLIFFSPLRLKHHGNPSLPKYSTPNVFLSSNASLSPCFHHYFVLEQFSFWVNILFAYSLTVFIHFSWSWI